LFDDPGESSKRTLRHKVIELVKKVIDERNLCPPGQGDSRKRVEETKPNDDVWPKLPELFSDFNRMGDNRGRIVHDRKMDRRRSYHLDFGVWNDLGGRQERSPSFEKGRPATVPPADFIIDDPDAMASFTKSLEEVMTLVRTPFDPVGLLEDENLHETFLRIFSGTRTREGINKSVLHASGL